MYNSLDAGLNNTWYEHISTLKLGLFVINAQLTRSPNLS